MGNLTVACVRVGSMYGVKYVERLRSMVARHLPAPHRFVCFTDGEVPDGVERINVANLGLPGWWSKMALFGRPEDDEDRVLYFDLDMVICGDLTPLAEWAGEFGVCGNFTRAAGHHSYPCRYGSCVMSLAPGWGWGLWETFWSDRDRIMAKSGYGDQQAIEALYPDATLLQDAMPAGFFLHYRDLPKHNERPENCAVVAFGGRSKPANASGWTRDIWESAA